MSRRPQRLPAGRTGSTSASRDSATIGGTIATNAGGLQVLRHGSTRAQLVGFEAVLGTGETVSHMGGLIKDNTGYDLGGSALRQRGNARRGDGGPGAPGPSEPRACDLHPGLLLRPRPRSMRPRSCAGPCPNSSRSSSSSSQGWTWSVDRAGSRSTVLRTSIGPTCWRRRRPSTTPCPPWLRCSIRWPPSKTLPWPPSPPGGHSCGATAKGTPRRSTRSVRPTSLT